MPVVSQFQGITVYMYTERDTHRLPHFHVYYGEYTASFAIDPPNLMEGALPRRQLRLVLAWAELREIELMENWHRVQNGGSPIRILGL